MMPSAVYELLANNAYLSSLGITNNRIIESQSIDERPFNDGYWLTVAFEESDGGLGGQVLGPRNTTIAVHHPWDLDRDYSPISKILNAIDNALLPVDQFVGSDGIRVSQIRRAINPRSGNQTDEGWRTITRWATYGVSYDELSV